jgi:hypothetical protein
MDTTDSLQEQLKSFHTHMQALHTLHQQNLAMRYFASVHKIQQEAQEAQAGGRSTQSLIVRVRCFVSRQLHTLAQVVEPATAPTSKDAEIEGACHVVEVSI